jgi:hypothetical protein
MVENNKLKSYSRLRDFMEDGEEDEPLYFAYSACLRIMGDDLPFEEIENALQLPATHKHRKGELKNERRSEIWRFKEDAWMIHSPLPEEEKLEKHLDWLWENLGSHKEYILSLKNRYRVDIFAGYRSNCDHAGVEIPIESMQIYYDLQIPFGLSIIVA